MEPSEVGLVSLKAFLPLRDRSRKRRETWQGHMGQELLDFAVSQELYILIYFLSFDPFKGPGGGRE